MRNIVDKIAAGCLGRPLSVNELNNIDSLMKYEVQMAIRIDTEMSVADLGWRIPMTMAKFIRRLHRRQNGTKEGRA